MTDFETEAVRQAMLDACGVDVVVGVYEYRGIVNAPTTAPYAAAGRLRTVEMSVADIEECGLADGTTIKVDGTNYTARHPRIDDSGDMAVVPFEPV